MGTSADQAQQTEQGAVAPLIMVDHLSKVYAMGPSRVVALREVGLQIASGEFVAIQGPSGSGKSTFMNLLGCLDRPTSGRYWLAGMEVSRLPADIVADVRNRRIGFVFQGFNLLARATALANVAQPLAYAGIPKHERERRALRTLQAVGLEGRAHHRPLQLSGGQQQRVAIARALVNVPSLLLADEPTGNLDSRTAVEIMAVLQQLNAQGLTIVLVTHEPDIAAYTRRRIQFRDGRLVRDEPVQAPRSATEDLQYLLWEQSTQESKEPRATAVIREEPQ
jgi:putative ABC transport system ATP-binding protein